MMKRLTLVRHAQAEAALAGQADFDRALTRRGEQDAAEMARRLKERGAPIDRIWSSPAARALATAEIFARALKIPQSRLHTDDRLYAAAAPDFLKIVRECDDAVRHLLLVAHNPGITEFADRLSSERGVDAMPTGAMVEMSVSIRSWTQLAWRSGAKVELDYPGRAA